MNRTAQFEYNSKKGLENYVSPFAKLFCVQVNNAPDIGKYYKSNSTVPGNEELVKLMSEPLASGFYGTFFGGKSD